MPKQILRNFFATLQITFVMKISLVGLFFYKTLHLDFDKIFQILSRPSFLKTCAPGRRGKFETPRFLRKPSFWKEGDLISRFPRKTSF